MKEHGAGYLCGSLYKKRRHFPLSAGIEFTFRCNLNCVHCYCKGSEDKDRELNTTRWKGILDDIEKVGCLHLTFSGGDPLIREDFLELYAYAKKKGFIISIFSNALGFTDEIIAYLVKSAPYSIEVTLNGITPPIYEAITQVQGSFSMVMENIKKIKRSNLPLILKSNCLKQNKNEIAKIKAFADRLLGKAKGKHHFKYDSMIFPRLNRDKAPTHFRLSFPEMLKIKRLCLDIPDDYEKGLEADFPILERDKISLYRCNSCIPEFIISPYGRLKFCQFSEDFSADLTNTPFREGFYNMFSGLLKEKFRTDSKCKDCMLRTICYNCPANAYLETGDKEAPVPYYCELAKETAKEIQITRHQLNNKD